MRAYPHSYPAANSCRLVLVTASLLAVIFYSVKLPIVFASSNDVVINEIAAWEKSDHEWFEVYNKGGQAVDLTGWKFYESKTNHGLTAYRGGMVVGPGEYAVIADVASNTASDYPSYAGILIDSSWETLSEGGEEIALKDSGGNIVEQFIYSSAPNHCLERVDATVADYTSTNWKESTSGCTIGAKNTVAKIDTPPVTPPVTETPATPPVETPATPSVVPAWRPQRGEVVINEFVADPSDSDKEWIELYNNTNLNLSLAGWTVEDGSKTTTALTGTMAGGGTGRYVVIEEPKGQLNNPGDMIVLKDDSGVIIDSVTYGNWDDGNLLDNAPTVHDPMSVARLVDGYNTFNNANDFRATSQPTKSMANIISNDSTDANSAVSIKGIVFSELFPNPVGDEKDGEFIELYNTTSRDVDLRGWQVVNNSGHRYTVDAKDFTSTVLSAQGYFVLPRKTTGIALRNSGGDSLKIFQPNIDSAVATTFYHESAPEGQSYVRLDEARWVWTTTPTPGRANLTTMINQAPEAVANFKAKAQVGELLVFDGSDSSDADKDELNYHWTFGDGETADSSVITHSYTKAGVYEVKLVVSDSSHKSEDVKQISVSGEGVTADQITVDNVAMSRPTYTTSSIMSITPGSIVLNEILPNPTGADKAEFIELFNQSSTPLDLGGWVVALQSGKQYICSVA